MAWQESDSLPFKLTEGSKSTPVSNGVPPLSRISYVLSKSKEKCLTFPIKSRYLVEFVPTGHTPGKRIVGRGEGGREIIVKPLVKFPIFIIQSENSTSTREYSETCHANVSPAVASKLRDKNCRLNLAWEGGIRRQMAFALMTAQGKLASYNGAFHSHFVRRLYSSPTC